MRTTDPWKSVSSDGHKKKTVINKKRWWAITMFIVIIIVASEILYRISRVNIDVTKYSLHVLKDVTFLEEI